MVELTTLLEPLLPDAARAFLQGARDDLRAGRADLAVLLPQLPRRIGRQPLADAVAQASHGARRLDPRAWRRCDAAALALFELLSPRDRAGRLPDLFAHGDLEERTMVLRCAAALPVDAATVALLGEAQRTNVGVHFEAMVLDSSVVADTVAHGIAGFGEAELNRLVLKTAFWDLPIARMFGVLEHANPELSRMLQDLATEREAATRKVWYDTGRVIARAPTDGTVARVLGGLEHGDDQHRLAAAEGIAWLARPELLAFARERLGREPRADVRSALERALSGNR